MKKLLLLVLLISVNTASLLAETDIKISGIYQGENLYVMNPFSPSGVGFCIFEVIVNGKTSTDEINSSAFEIDLSIYNFKLGDKVNIVIKHRDGCEPQILNPEVLKPKSTFNIEKISLNKNGTITWTTSGEIGSLPFYVEQFKWNKWVRVAKVMGKGSPSIHTYSAKIHFTTGENKFRVKQTDYTKKSRTSNLVTFNYKFTPVRFRPGNGRRTSKYVTFSSPTDYEVFNYYGQLIKKGYGKQIDVSKYKAGTYFLNYDNKTESFEKK